MPFFSTIVPAYNRERLIRATVDSLLNQEFSDQEIIVVDDGSSDRTLEVLAGYGDKIKVLRQQNQGPGAARNLGLQHATGEYAAMFDSDDLWFPWTLATYREAIERYSRPAFIAGCPVIFRDEGELRAVSRSPLRAEVFQDYLASGEEWRWFGNSSFVIRMDAVRAAGGFSGVRASSGADDADLALKLGTAPGFVDILEPLTFAYRSHPSGLSGNLDVAIRGAEFMLAQEESGAYPGGPARRAERERILCRQFRSISLQCLDQRRWSKAWAFYLRSLQGHLRERRLKYLLGFPLKAAWSVRNRGN